MNWTQITQRLAYYHIDAFLGMGATHIMGHNSTGMHSVAAAEGESVRQMLIRWLTTHGGIV